MFNSYGDISLVSRFVAGGALNTAFGFAIIFLLMALGVAAVTANVSGYAIGLLLSFTVNRRFVFRAGGVIFRELLRYGGAFMSSFVINLAVLQILIRHAQVNAFVAQIIATLIYVVVMFGLCRMFVFRGSEH
jgi:putative flippase GtrA